MMNVLQLCKKFPYPIKDGEGVAVYNIARAISESGISIDLLSFNTSKHHQQIDFDNNKLKIYGTVNTVSLDNKVSIFDAFFNLFTNQSFHIQRFKSEVFENKLIDILEKKEYDIIQLESIFMSPYIAIVKKYSKAKIVMRSHNIEYEIWENLSKQSSNPFKKWYYNLTANRLKTYEISQFSKYDILVPISLEDDDKYEKLGYKGESIPVTIGVDCKEYKNHFSNNKNISFVGSLDWLPNISGLKWFIENIWVQIETKSKLIIAGRNCPESLKQLKISNIEVLGEVDSIQEVFEKSSIFIVPIFSGSGVRVKILEAMASGMVVVSTSKGAEGIDYDNFNNILIWNTENEARKLLKMLFDDRINLEQISLNAMKFISENYNYRNIASPLIERYIEISQK